MTTHLELTPLPQLPMQRRESEARSSCHQAPHCHPSARQIDSSAGAAAASGVSAAARTPVTPCSSARRWSTVIACAMTPC